MRKVGVTKKTLARAARDQKAAVKTARSSDSYQNFMLNLGIGTDNALSGSTYGFNPVTRNRTLLEWIHRGSWLGGVAVDIVADDMTREGIDLQSAAPPDDIEKLHQAAVRLNIWPALGDTIRWSRLYGGAIGVFLIDGQDMRQPLRIDRVSKGQFRGIFVLDRWMVEPSLENLITELGPSLGLPEFYKVLTDAPGLRGKVIHHTRCIRLEGIRLPYWQRVMENLWGISVLERLYDRMVAFDSATQGAAQLVYKSFIRTYSIKGLRELVAEGGPAEAGLVRYVQMMRRFQGIEGITLIDGDDRMDALQSNVQAGISDALVQFGQQLSGALETPLVRLFGQSPAGLNSTGESDLITYYDGINQKQESRLRTPVQKVYRLLAMSEGVKLDEQFNFSFAPLWQMKDTEKASVDVQDTDNVLKAEERGVISQKVALQELRQRGRITGRWTNITDEMIDAADDTVAPSMEELDAPELSDTAGEGKTVDAVAGQVIRIDNGDLILTSEEPHWNDFHKRYYVWGRRWVKSKGAFSGANSLWNFRSYEPANLPQRDSLPYSVVSGFQVAIEHRKGERRWTGGPALEADYGYIRRVGSTEGPGEWMDVIVGPNHQSTACFVYDMYNGNRFEEHKIVLGFDNESDARQCLHRCYKDVPVSFAGNVEMTTEELQRWLENGKFDQPISEAQL